MDSDGSVFKPESLLYGTTSITVISLLSLMGLVFLPVIKGKWRNRWMQVFIALAAATLSSDALLHILPQVVGVHDHLHHDHGHKHHHHHNHLQMERSHSHHHHNHHEMDHNHSLLHRHEMHHNHSSHHRHGMGHNHSDYHHHEIDHKRSNHEMNHNHSDYHYYHHHYHSDHKNYDDGEFTSDDHSMLLKMTAVIGTVYILYILEFISALPIWKEKNQYREVVKISVLPQKHSSDCETGSGHSIEDGHHGMRNGIADEPVVMCGLNSAAFVIIFGDAIHNFIDGITVGASFAISNQVGIATSVAVACHELPHELGDFAVLIESGLSISRAMFLNFLSSLTAYAGLFVGLAAINVDNAVEILLAITAGMFLYVAWLDMLIHLKKESASTNDEWYITLPLQNVGFVIGFVIMFIIGWYEEELESL